MRVDKLLTEKTSLSRREAHKAVRVGRVLVNGVRVLAFDHPVVRQQDVLTLDGNMIATEEFVYYMLHKPKGYVCATEDAALPTVMELVPEQYRQRDLFPAGRLDKDTTGFVLLTNNGELAHQILSPKGHVEKEYLVTLDGAVTEEMCKSFAQGMTLNAATVREKGRDKASKPILCAPAQLCACEDNDCVGRVVLRQGMFHQIKRMFAACGRNVTALHRVRMGKLFLDKDLGEGALRPLSLEEIGLLTEKS